MNIIKIILTTIFIFVLTPAANADISREEIKFLEWYSKQDQKVINSYVNYVNSCLENKINPIDLFIDRHEDAEECNKEIFVVPPKSMWPQIVLPIKLLRYLSDSGIVGEHIILSTFRTDEINRCIGGAKHSKHLNNAAVDFRITSSYEETEKALCSFWRKSGRKYNMGLGAYGDGFYHIDRSGYRTWGSSYSGSSSMCK